MTTILESGDFRYEVNMDWAKLPQGWTFHEVADVAVDSKDRVYVFSRGKHPLIVFDREGNFLYSWGEGVFKRPHGVTVGPDETLYCADDGDHTVRKCTLDGKVLMTLGTPDKPAPAWSGHPFNRPTKVAVDPKTGEFYVTDGYGNSRVHKYSPDGELLFSWGQPGTEPGEFNIVHTVCLDKEGLVYVADRENDRVQIFDPKGKYITQWNNMHRACPKLGRVSVSSARKGSVSPAWGTCYLGRNRTSSSPPTVLQWMCMETFMSARYPGPRWGANYLRPGS